MTDRVRQRFDDTLAECDFAKLELKDQCRDLYSQLQQVFVYHMH